MRNFIIIFLIFISQSSFADMSDIDIIRSYLKGAGDSGYKLVVRDYKTNTKLMIEAVKIDPNLLVYADETLSKNKEVFLEAIKINGDVMEFADDSLRSDKEFVSEALKLNCESFEYASQSLSKNKKFILQLVKQSASSCPLKYIDDTLKIDKEFIMEKAKNLVKDKKSFRSPIKYTPTTLVLSALEKKANTIQKMMKKLGYAPRIVKDSGTKFYHVTVGSYDSELEAKLAKQSMQEKHPRSLVLQLFSPQKIDNL